MDLLIAISFQLSYKKRVKKIIYCLIIGNFIFLAPTFSFEVKKADTYDAHEFHQKVKVEENKDISERFSDLVKSTIELMKPLNPNFTSKEDLEKDSVDL